MFGSHLQTTPKADGHVIFHRYMTNAARDLGVIENAGPNNLKAFLKDRLETGRSVDIGVAFVTASGLREVMPMLKKASSQSAVRILTGFYQCFTEPQALRSLLRWKSQSKAGRVEVRVSRDQHFHWKAYFIFGPSRVTISIGSSNLTADGLKSSGEINLTLSLPKTAATTRSIHGVFEKQWNRATPLTSTMVAEYAKQRSTLNIRSHRPSISLRKILGVSESPKESQADIDQRSFWRAAISGFVDSITETIIEEETNWNAKGYDWFSTVGSRLEPKDMLVLFDLKGRRVDLVEVKDVTTVSRRTSSGRHFAAYSAIKGARYRKLTPSLWKRLRDEGLLKNQNDRHRNRKLSHSRFTVLVECLGLKR